MKQYLVALLLGINILSLFYTHDAQLYAGTGDSTVVQTFRFDTTMRAGVFHFPDDSSKSYEKIIMRYGMRCKNGLVSTTSNRNLGCGEWDYNCYTFIIDSTQTDSIASVANRFLISSVTDTLYPFTTVPVYDFINNDQYQVTYTSVIAETTAQPGNGNLSVRHPLGGAAWAQRTQYLWTAAELLTAGLTAGPITGMRMERLGGISSVENLRIGLKHTSQSQLDENQPELTGFSPVYFLSTPFTVAGTTAFNFYDSFLWDGVSNVLMDINYSMNGIAASDTCEGHASAFTSTLVTNQSDNFLRFIGNGAIVTPDTTGLSSITDEITLAFWSYGDTAQLPSTTSIAYAMDNSSARQLNVHLPWSDGNIYWDCGGSGGSFDRISRQALAADFEGRWTFWTFTKNATTGEMKIYIDGHEWMSGTGKTIPINMKRFWLGASPNGYLYKGDLDEVSLWNKALDSTAIAAIMYKSITPAHPDYSFLKLYYKFDEGSGNTATDSGPVGNNAFITQPNWRNISGRELFRNFTSTSERPDVTFVQGVYTSSVQTFLVQDSVLRSPNQIIERAVIDNSLIAIDTTAGWKAGQYAYIYDPSGMKLDSILIVPTDTIFQSTLNYHQKRPMSMELIDFITPYGINLNLNGLNGKYWEFDVTDFAPLLRGPRYMEMAAGKYQEENDISFIFYEGTPPRNVLSIQNIWPNGTWTSASWSQIYNNVFFEPRNLVLDPSASMYKIRSAISGHGQEGEFISRNHTLTLNGNVNFTRAVWNECATNPIYPQGGTWIYDRAGWCPGQNVEVVDYEITPHVAAGQSISIDYSMPFIANPGTSNYRVNNTLITYGPPNFTTDASVFAIKSPSVRTEYTRFNPICDDPVIIIRNTGADTLTSLDITYGREGGTMSTYNWNGSLAFLEKTEVILPAPVWLGSGIDRFVVSVSAPNGMNDQYAANDTMSTDFIVPDSYTGGIVLEYKPNNFLSQNTFTVKDAQGNTLLTRTATVGGFIYRDTLNLPDGCYSIYMNDSGDDGLSFWANTNQGTGYFRIRSRTSTALLKTFNPDFGDNVNYQFTMNYTLPVDQLATAPARITVFPNPSGGAFTLTIAGQRYSAVQITMMDLTGREVYREKLWLTQPEQSLTIHPEGVPAGVYLLQSSGEGWQDVQRIVIQ